MKAFLLTCVVALACACTPHEVRCDGHLQPINATAEADAAPPRTTTTPGDL